MDKQEALCQRFVQVHNINMTDAVRREAVAIYWTHRARSEIQALGPLSSEKPIEAQLSWLVLNQVFDHAEGSLVALVTGFGKSASVIARTAAESAVALMYILEADTKSRIFQFLLHPIREERNRLDKLRKSKAGVDFESSYFDDLSRTCDLFEKIIKRWAAEAGYVITTKNWPDTFRLFDQTGYESHYRTAYAAMSAATHGTSAHMLSALIFLNYAVSTGKDDDLRAFLDSAVLQQRMAVYSGVLFSLEAGAKYCERFGLTRAAQGVFDGKDAVWVTLASLAHQDQQVTEIFRR